VIAARRLTKSYGTTRAVDDLTFEVRPGVVTGFLGPNGSGKSTTMRMVMGLDHPDSGTVTIDGKRFHDLRWPLRQVGALLEAKAIHPGRSAYNHLLAMAQTNSIPKPRVDEVLGLVGLDGVARRKAGKFSLGMSQRLGIASALLGDPGVLLFDEPINGLDPEGILWVRNLLKSLANEGRTIFVSSHLMSEMALTATDLVVIGRGQLIADTTPSMTSSPPIPRPPCWSAHSGPIAWPTSCGPAVPASACGRTAPFLSPESTPPGSAMWRWARVWPSTN
jgi:ABC-2 type transport system ATP-binding protein